MSRFKHGGVVDYTLFVGNIFFFFFRSAGLTMALDIQLKLGLDEDVGEAFKQIGDRIPFTKHLDMAACSRSAWQGKLFTPDASDDKTASGFVKLFELSQGQPARL